MLPLDPNAPAEDRFAAAFDTSHGQTLNGTNAAVAARRPEAIARFKALGLPTHKDEAYKYTNIRKVFDRPYLLPLAPERPDLTTDDLAPFLIDDLDAHVVVTVNGRYDADLSRIGDLPDGVVLTGFQAASRAHADLVDAHYGQYADAEDEALTALNTAFVQDGVFFYVPKGTALERPVHVVHLGVAEEDDLLMQPRHLFVVEEGAIARLIETYDRLGPARTLSNTVREIVVGPRANFDHYLVQTEGDQGAQVQTTVAEHRDHSVFSTLTVTLSGEVVRNNLTIVPDGDTCESHLIGLFLGQGAMHVDNHTLVDHVHPDCFSNELYKGVLGGRSTGVFNGKVHVRPDAQRINAYQSNKSIVLSDEAKMFAKPELEIYADDVQCSHGATTGQLDEEGVFYLRSRGLSEERARLLMLQAFAQDVIDEIKSDALRAALTDRVRERFAAFADA
jgi:Fe-S cluster assembly protein SufD